MAERAAADPLLVQLHALGLELLGDWYLRPELRSEWQPLPIELFYDRRLQSIAKLANDGIEPRDLALALSRNGAAHIWPHPGDAVDLLLEAPTRGLPFQRQAAALRETFAKRKLRDLLQAQAANTGGLDLEKIMGELHALKPADDLAPLPVLSMDDLFAPLGPEPWICEALALQPGAPWMLSGNSGRGKSWLVSDLALAVASGQKFGGLNVRQGKVRWIHLEGSKRDLMKRTQMLALGRGIGPDELRGNFLPSVHPSFNFADPLLEKRLIRDCTDCVMCVIDTFAVAAAGMNENDSAIRQPLDMLGRVSEATGCAFVVIHHHKKDGGDPKFKPDLEMMTRGSGAIANALSASWAITRIKNKDRGVLFKSQLTLTKSWFGDRDPLVIEACHSHIVGGAVDLHISRAPEADGSATPETDRDYSEIDARILETVKAHPDSLTLTGLCGLLKLRRPLVSERIEAMRLNGLIEREPGPRGAFYIRIPGLNSGPASTSDQPSNL